MLCGCLCFSCPHISFLKQSLAQNAPKLRILLSLSPECGDERHVPLCLAPAAPSCHLSGIQCFADYIGVSFTLAS